MHYRMVHTQHTILRFSTIMTRPSGLDAIHCLLYLKQNKKICFKTLFLSSPSCSNCCWFVSYIYHRNLWFCVISLKLHLYVSCKTLNFNVFERRQYGARHGETKPCVFNAPQPTNRPDSYNNGHPTRTKYDIPFTGNTLCHKVSFPIIITHNIDLNAIPIKDRHRLWGQTLYLINGINVDDTFNFWTRLHNPRGW